MFDIEKFPLIHGKKPKTSHWFTVLFSVFFHLILIALCAFSFSLDTQRPAFQKPITPDQKPINAVLVFPTSAIPNDTEIPQRAIVKTPETRHTGSLSALPKQKAIEEPAIVGGDIPSKTENPPKIDPPRRIKKSTQAYLQRQFQQRLHNLSETESEQYRQGITSPKLNIPNWQSITTEPEVKPIVVRCDNQIANTVRLLGNIMGGRMRCNATPDIDPFIQKRINKNQGGENN